MYGKYLEAWRENRSMAKKILPKYQKGVKDGHFPLHLWTIHIMTCYYLKDSYTKNKDVVKTG